MLLRPLLHTARGPLLRTFAAQAQVKTAAKLRDAANVTTTKAAKKAAPLRNAVGVQLLSRRLHEQLFPGEPFPAPPPNFVAIAKEHLALHGLDPKQGSKLPDIAFDLPPLQGGSIDEHFHNVGRDIAEPYLSMAQEFAAEVKRGYRLPGHWNTQHSGWTRYHRGKIAAEDYFDQVDAPDETMLCFDVETMPHIHPFAVMATARSQTHWYSWLSPWLLGETDEMEQLIPLGDPSVPRIVVGHNVSYDRARIREEYSLERTATRFIDTMSLHVAVKGISSHQRPAWMKWKKEKKETIEVVQNMLEDTDTKLAAGAAPDAYDELLNLRGDLVDSLERLALNGDSNVEEKRWEELTSANSLADVAMLHCGITVRKAVRDDFLVASREDIAGNLDKYLTYCATDVKTTYAVFRAVFPKFIAACPSPVSFAGVMSMGSAFLTVNQEWEKYLQSAEAKYRELERAVKVSLLQLAKEAVMLSSFAPEIEEKPAWKDDVWLSQLDWTPKQLTARSRRATVVTPSIPAWLADLYKGATSNLAKRTIPFVMQARYFGYPLFLASDGAWVYGVPKGTTDESNAVPCPEFEEQTGGRLSFFSPKANKKVKTIVTASFGARLFANGTFSFRGGDAGRDLMYALALTRTVDGEAEKIDERVWAVAREVARAGKPQPVPGVGKAEPGDDTWWGDQLDWTPVPGSLEHHRPLCIPAWYRELLPRIEDAEAAHPSTPEGLDELDLTTRTAAAPLLLRLGWRGHPLFRSREHGWMYRVPRDRLDEVPAQEKAREFSEAHDVDALGPMLEEFAFFKLPHKDGEEANVGNPLSKTFMKYAQDGTMTSPSAATRLAIDLNAQSSYWISARDRVLQQVVVWDKERLRLGLDSGKLGEGEKWGMIIPQVITMGTVTRRAIEKTWLTASNAKSNRIGSELKAMVRAPPGYAIVGADVDSEELWISSVMGDAQFGLHGATAIGWMTLEGTKSAGTDLHSKTASILGISRNEAKVFNYSRIYGAGMKHASLLLLQSNPGMSLEKAQELATELYARTKGRNTHRTDIFDRKFWFGGSESYVFNKLEEIAMSDRPQTPALGCGVTDALAKEYLPQTFGSDYLPSRINWVVQSSGVDYLHLLIVSMEYLLKTYDIKARYLISVHDELRYLVPEEDKYRCALALQIANLWTRCQFAWRLGMDDLPQGVAFFSAVDVDWLLRKEVDMPCVTPSQPTPLAPGESLDMQGILEKTHGGSLRREGELALPPPEPLPRDSGYIAPNHLSHRATTSHFLKAQATQEFGEVKLMAKLATSKDYTGSPGARTFRPRAAKV